MLSGMTVIGDRYEVRAAAHLDGAGLPKRADSRQGGSPRVGIRHQVAHLPAGANEQVVAGAAHDLVVHAAVAQTSWGRRPAPRPPGPRSTFP